MVVLTKLDNMDAGTDATELLEGRLVPLRLGIIGDVNRSQANTDKGQSIEECLVHEEQFLRSTYPTLAAKNGIKFLTKALNRVSNA